MLTSDGADGGSSTVELLGVLFKSEFRMTPKVDRHRLPYLFTEWRLNEFIVISFYQVIHHVMAVLSFHSRQAPVFLTVHSAFGAPHDSGCMAVEHAGCSWVVDGLVCRLWHDWIDLISRVLLDPCTAFLVFGDPKCEIVKVERIPIGYLVVEVPETIQALLFLADLLGRVALSSGTDVALELLAVWLQLAFVGKGLGTRILDGVEARASVFIECDQLTVNGSSHGKGFAECCEDLRELLGKVLAVLR
jgi:hypothetical protein